MLPSTTAQRQRLSVLTKRIRRHYNLLTPFYYGLWGQHIHHGYWEDERDRSTPKVAQERLIHELYRFAGAPRGSRVLDVGCGVGGSLLWLAEHAGARGGGLTISPLQRLMGAAKIVLAGQRRRLRIAVADAQARWPRADQSVDLVWCMECSEHLHDRTHFAREAYRVLSAGGSLALTAWLASDDPNPAADALRATVADGMLCPPFSTTDEYRAMLTAAGFADVEFKIVTQHVERTWKLCIELRDRPAMRRLSSLLGGDVAAFTESFNALYRAYREGAMEYGMFVAHKEEST